ncbi:hypothetical protein F542_2650 [Bibersteinia trehalosi USDA-ARS-USMARC-188]|uniref:Uncharacterized protein n=3 Tax=Bibersteinia trehalosi TaxID=47735 RepID=A0A4V7I7I6_BIBTR|nr:hypothetical protein [Bibersteinia trehalosi]AGH39271.1 hypothetical protein WQG_19940 [Bibersteinia trehalosi USDA-ARS-USMARC-192]AHG80983.1 hypothetical protein F542_2650 [Bibersteinia trehalosi USDA-ARS-USMARC-188]AHG83195.1 hypothetical protein F543_3310 [Bibersteinia trehalosi USDA-ARS-USMARC-189]OAQ14206.1 hypothetical protein F480_07390 [Bibersteinia trehalosi Y31]
MQSEQTQNTVKSGFMTSFLTALILAASGAGAGYWHATSQPQQWKATAKFEAPKVADLGNYFSLLSTYTLVQNDGKADPNLEKNVTQGAFTEFTRQLASADNRQQFLSNNAIIKQIAEVHNKPLNEVVNQLSEKLQFNPADNSLSFALVNPTQSVQVLNEFIALTTEQSRKVLNDDLVAKWKFLFQNVKQSADANLGESWKGKLNLMQSVQPLDNQLTAYHFVQKPSPATKAEQPDNLTESIGFGAGIGFLLGLLLTLFRRK